MTVYSNSPSFFLEYYLPLILWLYPDEVRTIFQVQSGEPFRTFDLFLQVMNAGEGVPVRGS